MNAPQMFTHSANILLGTYCVPSITFLIIIFPRPSNFLELIGLRKPLYSLFIYLFFFTGKLHKLKFTKGRKYEATSRRNQIQASRLSVELHMDTINSPSNDT